MIDYADILRQTPNGVLATQDGKSIRTRVFQYLFTDGNKVYFCTSSDKPVYGQLKANPNVSFCTFPQDFNPVLSLSGRAVFSDDLALKTRVFEEKPLIRGIFKTPDNPMFRLFYIDVKDIDTYSFAEGAKRYTP